MMRTELKNAGASEDPLSIAWHNMEEADRNHSLEFFSSAAISWILLHPGKTFKDLELELRKRKHIQTHLIGVKYTISANHKLQLPGNGSPIHPPEFECISSCRSSEDACREMLEICGDDAENLRRLERSGSKCGILFCESNKCANDWIERLPDGKHKLVMACRAKLTITRIPLDEVMQTIFDDCVKKTGREPILAVAGLACGGRPVMSYVLDGRIVCPFGIAVGKDKSAGRLDRELVEFGQTEADDFILSH